MNTDASASIQCSAWGSVVECSKKTGCLRAGVVGYYILVRSKQLRDITESKPRQVEGQR